MEERLVNGQTQVLDKRPWVDGPTIVGILSLAPLLAPACWRICLHVGRHGARISLHDRDRSAVDVLSVYHHALHDHPAGA